MRRFSIAVLLSAALLPVSAHAVVKKVVRKAPARAAAAAVPLSPADAFLAANARQRGVVKTASGLQYRVTAPGTGTAKPTDDDIVLINYVGKLTNGTTFDQSRQPTPMPVAGVVPGFSEALKAMPKGAKYRVWIKPSLGYGDVASGPIPAGSVLVFDIELLDFISNAQFQQMRQEAQQAQQAQPPASSEPAKAPN